MTASWDSVGAIDPIPRDPAIPGLKALVTGNLGSILGPRHMCRNRRDGWHARADACLTRAEQLA